MRMQGERSEFTGNTNHQVSTEAGTSDDMRRSSTDSVIISLNSERMFGCYIMFALDSKANTTYFTAQKCTQINAYFSFNIMQ